MTFYLSLIAAIAAGISLALHALGKRNSKAEAVAEMIDDVEKAATPLLPK